MQKNKTYRVAGMFVFVGLFCLAAVIYHYLSKTFSQKDSEYPVMYFEESITGLNVGSPIVFKGVEVGQVIGIKLIIDLQTGTFKTPVYAMFKENKAFQLIAPETMRPEEVLKDMVAKGLRARLESANYLTGQLMIEMVMDPESKINYVGNSTEKEIPTIMSSFGVISKDLQEIPLKETMLRVSNIVKELDDQLPDILQNVSQTTENINKITTKMENLMERKSYETTKSLANFNSAMEEIAKTGIAIKNLADYLERHPEAIVRGKEYK